MNSEHLVPITLPGYPFRIYQTKAGQTVTQDTQFLLDTVLTHFSNQPIKVLELGSGTGVLSILMKLQCPDWNITGIEIQSHLVELSLLNAALCNIHINFREGDIRQISADIPMEHYDLIVSNPPYFRIGEFRLSSNQEKSISRHELLCTMDDVVEAVRKMMKRDGRAYLIYPFNRVEELKKKIKNIDLQFITDFSLSTMNNKYTDKSVIVELAHADHR